MDSAETGEASAKRPRAFSAGSIGRYSCGRLGGGRPLTSSTGCGRSPTLSSAPSAGRSVQRSASAGHVKRPPVAVASADQDHPGSSSIAGGRPSTPSIAGGFSPTQSALGSAPSAGRSVQRSASAGHIKRQSVTTSATDQGRSGSSGVAGGLRSSRFTREEKNCFWRVPTPSAACEGKRLTSPSTVEAPPVSPTKRRTAHKAQLPSELQIEAMTSEILEAIYPRHCSSKAKKKSANVGWGLVVIDGGEDHREGAASTPHPHSSGPDVLQRVRSSDLSARGRRQSQNCCEAEPSTPTPSHASRRGSKGVTPLSTEQGRPSFCVDDVRPVLARVGTLTPCSGGQPGMSSPEVAGPCGPMALFRRMLLDRFSSIKAAFEFFAKEYPENHQLTIKEWKRVLLRHGFVFKSLEVRDALLEALDISGDGMVSCSEFHIAVEAAAPLRTLLDLRRRWLASGYPSMLHTLNILDDWYPSKRPLTFAQFREALAKVKVMDPGEVVAVFHAFMSSDASRCTISELGCAIATVSPCLLLEDLGERLKRKFGMLDKAFSEVDIEHRGVISQEAWVDRSVRKLGLTEIEAAISFRQMDVDQNLEISADEFIVCLSLSSSTHLFLEDLRRRVRQRFRSIQQVLFDYLEDTSIEEDPMRNVPIPRHGFKDLLSKLELMEEETFALFDIIDVNKSGELTASQFLRGIRHFVPSVVLEDLRHACLTRLRQKDSMLSPEEYAEGSKRHTMADIFGHYATTDRWQSQDFASLSRILEELDFQEGLLKLQDIFDLLDVKLDNTISIGRLLAALQAGGAGSAARLPEQELELKARAEARSLLEANQRRVATLKKEVREGIMFMSPRDDVPASPRSIEEPNSPKNSPIPAAQPSPMTPEDRSIDRSEGAPSPKKISKRQMRAISSLPMGCSLTGIKKSSKLGRRVVLERARLRAEAIEKAQEATEKAVDNIVSGTHPGQRADEPMDPFGTNSFGSKPLAEPALPHDSQPPRLKTTKAEKLTPYVSNLGFRTYDTNKPSENSMFDTHRSWGEVWGRLKKSSGAGAPDRCRLEKECYAYFQSATFSLTHDVPLLQDNHKLFKVYCQTRRHEDAINGVVSKRNSKSR